MNYLVFDQNEFTSTGFTASNEGLGWLLDPKLGIGNIPMRLHYSPEYIPEPLPPVPLVPEPGMNREKCLPGGSPPDYLGFGRYNFVSPRLKAMFESHEAAVHYSDAYLSLDGETYPYFLFAPTLGIDAMDKERSVFEEDPDRAEPIRIRRIEKLVLDESKILSEPAVFVLAGTVKRVFLLREDIGVEFDAAGITGMDILPIAQSNWMY